jgi:hypothetical protein
MFKTSCIQFGFSAQLSLSLKDNTLYTWGISGLHHIQCVCVCVCVCEWDCIVQKSHYDPVLLCETLSDLNDIQGKVIFYFTGTGAMPWIWQYQEGLRCSCLQNAVLQLLLTSASICTVPQNMLNVLHNSLWSHLNVYHIFEVTALPRIFCLLKGIKFKWCEKGRVLGTPHFRMLHENCLL